MCGVFGFLELGGFREERASHQLKRMSDETRHRGPDAAGEWMDSELGVALGHRRLAILDLSPAGDQPMASHDGRYLIVFNGEIYNHEELRQQVGDRVTWRGRSDTESLLAHISVFGIEATLRASVGMFALALWDRDDRTLTLARDRMGEKPLYYGWQGDTFLFASELKALRSHPAMRNEVDEAALAAFLKYGYVPAPLTIYAGLAKLPPGSMLTLPFGSGSATEGELRSYWSLEKAMAAGAKEPFTGSDAEAVDALDRHLSNAISGQLMSDVPLGAFLSGGIDSSLVVSLMQRLVSRPVRTYTIGFGEGEYDESAAARSVAQHLGTEHFELIVTPDEALAVIPRLSHIYDEPFADASAVPTWLLAGLAKRDVSVALSGDGGDELFAGYDRYRRTSQVWQMASAAPAWLRGWARSGLGWVPAAEIQQFLVRHRIGGHPHLFQDRVKGLRAAFTVDSVEEFYDVRVSNWPDPSAILHNTSPTSTWASRQRSGRPDPTERMMAFDARSYMVDGVLVKVDRAAMSHSLETRVPLLDHRVVEFAWSLPHSMRVRDGTSKWLLRQLLYRHVPKELVDRPKKGFGVPLGTWLRGPLRPWAEGLLSRERLEGTGPFRADPILRLWAEHQSGSASWEHRLWPVLMYQAWAAARTGARSS